MPELTCSNSILSVLYEATIATYTTPKRVKIRDYRLGLTLRACQVAIFSYVLYDVINKRSYLATEVPVGLVTAFSPPSSAYDQYQDDVYKQQRDGQSGPPFCNNNPAYNFHYGTTASYTYTNMSCAFLTQEEVAKKTLEGNMFFTTAFQEDRLVTLSTADGDADCAATLVRTGREHELAGYRATSRLGTCEYRRTNTHFVLGVEKMVLTYTHSYHAVLLQGTRVFSGSLPRTKLRRYGSDEDLRVYDRNEEISITIEDLLNLTGVRLDRPVNRQEPYMNVTDDAMAGTGSSAGEYPYVRLTGVEMVMRLKYYNYDLGDGSHGGGDGPHDLVCIWEVQPKLHWTSSGGEQWPMLNSTADPHIRTLEAAAHPPRGDTITYLNSRYAYGISMNFQAVGMIGTYSYQALINAIIAGLVMLGVADMIVNFMAQSVLKPHSDMYKEFMTETVQFESVFARFAVQAMVSGSVFQLYDNNKSGSLDRAELTVMLRDLAGAKLDQHQIEILTDLVMKYADSEAQGEEGAPQITIAEWIDAFVEDQASFRGLAQWIDMHQAHSESAACAHSVQEGHAHTNPMLAPDMEQSLADPKARAASNSSVAMMERAPSSV